MGRVCALVAAILPVAVALMPAAPVRAAEPASVKIGLPENMFHGVPAAVVGPASRPFQTMFEKQTGLKGTIAVEKDYASIADKLRSGTLDIAVFHGYEYAWVRQHHELVPLLTTVPSKKLQACLVVNANSKAKGACDLKGDCIAVPGTTKAYCRIYLERLKSNLPEGSCGTAKPDTKSIEEVLDAIAGGSCEAALVDTASLAAYQNNKPGVGAQLKVLAQSDPFPPAVIVYRKDAFTAQTATKVRNSLIRGVEKPEGRLLTGLWKLKGFAEPTTEYQKELDECLKAFPAPKK